MEYIIDIQNRDICVKDEKGYWASSEEYGSFCDAFRIFTEPINQSNLWYTLTFTKRAQEVLNSKQRKTLKKILSSNMIKCAGDK